MAWLSIAITFRVYHAVCLTTIIKQYSWCVSTANECLHIWGPGQS